VTDLLDPIRLASILVMWLSLSVHEWAHARSAYALGDDTAKALGRMTLDPMAHVDFVGTLLLPLIGVPFGWAKPVPVNPTRFRRDVKMSFGMMLTAAAGPASNVVLSVLCLGFFAALWNVAPTLAEGPAGQIVAIAMVMNLLLAVFNMVPIPPLDGSRVAAHFMPRSLLPFWHGVERAGIFLPFLVIWGLRAVGIDIFAPFVALCYDLLRAVIP